jgi:hypothetical protein
MTSYRLIEGQPMLKISAEGEGHLGKHYARIPQVDL